MLFRSTVLAAATSCFAVVQAQYKIDPESVDINQREVWCRNQKETCPKICEQTEPQTTLVNDCDAETLTYGCLCGNNQKPNISEYSLTLPFFVCREWTNQCVADCKGDNACASSCREDHPCGAQNPTRVTVTSSTMDPTASKSDGPSSEYTGSSRDDDDDDNGASTLLGVGQAYGKAIVFGTMFLAFAMM